MKYSIKFMDQKSHLLCITDGVVDNVEDFIAWALAVIGKAKEMQQRVLLIDNRLFRLDLTAHDVITFAEYLDHAGAAQLGLKMAVLSNPENKATSRMVETALINRSGSYRSFLDREEAVRWLDI